LKRVVNVRRMQQHGQNKKLKRQSQMLLDKLNGVNLTVAAVLPELEDAPDDEKPANVDDADYHSALSDKVNSSVSHVLLFCVTVSPGIYLVCCSII